MNLTKIGKTFRLTLLLILMFEILSYLGWYWPAFQAIVFWIIVGLTLLIAIKQIDVALWIVLAELFIGSKGYLFQWNISEYAISIRLALFITLFLVWFIKYVLVKRRIVFRKSKLFWWYVGFLMIYAWGIINGIINNNSSENIFYDANGFLFFGLIFIIYEVVTNKEKINKLLQVLFASVTAIAIKTFVLLILFAGQYSILPELYRWVRDTRVNEVTLITHNFYRIFSQSQIYSFLLFILVFVILFMLGKVSWNRDNWFLKITLVLSSMSVLVSYSRSFWLSLIVTLVVIYIFFVTKYKYSIKKIFKNIFILIALMIVEVGLVFVIINIPNWIKVGGESASLSSLIEERLGNAEGVGLQSRWNLVGPLTRKIVHNPILGTGFGSEITYQSEDPRLVEENGGIYTTYTFEWGYLDIVLKVGILGLIIYLLFIWNIAKYGFNTIKSLDSERKALSLGLLFGLLALVITHMTTPYLNHPLGICYLLICAVTFERLQNEPRDS
ncbi:O-antigen ligase family protein [Patescibacteria group bacterium]|nr:O-antigen ligase family protein [Patescibacteria group bacterium]MBU1890900.1 O-antigen ligase family protein [Patescibacteria group bacterium]